MIPPSTICPMTPATSPSDSHVRSRRRGRRHSEPSTASDHDERDEPGEQAVDLLDGGVADETSTSCWSLQCGQSSQPSPEPVRRTAAPVMTMVISSPRATAVMVR